MDQVENAIAAIKTKLKYNIEYDNIEDDSLNWSFRSVDNTHIICRPKTGECPIDLLHEYLHALHKEDLPGPFSDEIPPIDPPIPWGFELRVNFYFNVIRDWLVDAQIMTLCPVECGEYIRNDYRKNMDRIQNCRTVDDKMIVGLALAQYTNLLNGSEVPEIQDHDIRRVYDLLLGIPTVPNLVQLYAGVANLADIFGEFKLEQKTIEIQESWHVMPKRKP